MAKNCQSLLSGDLVAWRPWGSGSVDRISGKVVEGVFHRDPEILCAMS